MAVDYSFKPYNPHFPALFQAEKQRILSYLSFPVRIEHLGSTAVRNLGGKGIIDIYVVVDTDLISKAKDAILHAGYEARPAEGNDKRFVYVRVADNEFGGQQRYHLHLCLSDSEDFQNGMIFCKYLQDNPKVAKEYAEIKQQAAEKALQSKEIYLAIKGPFIKRVTHEAKRELPETASA